jgi:hypothetical protein
MPSCDIVNELLFEPQTVDRYPDNYTWNDNNWEENTWGEEDTWGEEPEPEPQKSDPQPEVADTGPSVADDTSELSINPKWQTKGPEARINSVWLEHNVSFNNTYGIIIHTDFDVQRFKGSQGSVAAYFYFENGTPLEDFNDRYSTYDGQVAVSDNFIPRYDSSNFADFKLFIPYDELHMDFGRYELKVNVQIWGGSSTLSNPSNWVYFTFTRE